MENQALNQVERTKKAQRRPIRVGGGMFDNRQTKAEIIDAAMKMSVRLQELYFENTGLRARVAKLDEELERLKKGRPPQQAQCERVLGNK